MGGATFFPWPEILDQPQQHARAGIGVVRLDMLGRVMADAATAAHEQHGDVGDVDHRHAVMPRPARQFEHAIAFGRNRFEVGRELIPPDPVEEQIEFATGEVLKSEPDPDRGIRSPLITGVLEHLPNKGVHILDEYLGLSEAAVSGA